MRRILFISLIWIGLLQAGSGSELLPVIKKALAGDREVYSSDYLADSFAKWLEKSHFTAGGIDTQFVNGTSAEIWIRDKNSPAKGGRVLAVLVSRESAARIVDARRLFFTDRSSFSGDEQTVMEFIEKLLWIHETRDESLVFDHLFPEFIKAEYEGSTDKKSIVLALQKRYPGVLPLREATWEKEGPFFQIHLKFANDLKGLDINLNIEKFLTVRAFEMHDQVEMVRMLVDSLMSWPNRPEFPAGQAIKMTAPSAAAALEQLMAPLTDLYHIQKKMQKDSLATLQVSAPSLDSLESVTLRFAVSIQETAAKQFLLKTRPFSPGTPGRAAKMDTTAQAVEIFCHRYGTLGLPALFWPRSSRDATAFKLRIHGRSTDSLVCDQTVMTNNLLEGLTRGKQIFFFLRDATSRRDTLILRGVGIWKDPHLYRHHLARITEEYTSRSGKIELLSTAIDLHPFIRTDNLKPANL